MNKFLTFGVVSLLLSGCVTTPWQEEEATLSAAEVRRLFVGNTVESYNLKSSYYSFTYYHPDGQAIQERLWSRRLGRWEIRDDGQICLSFNARALKCRHIVFSDDRYYKVRPDESGRPERIVRYRYFAPGNALTGR